MEMPAARALGVSKGQSHSAGEGERATLGPDSSLEHPPASKVLCHKNPREPIFFEDDVLGQNQQTQDKDSSLYQGLQGFISPHSASLPSLHIHWPCFRPLYLLCGWLPQGLCMCCSPYLECSSPFTFTLLAATHLSHLSSKIASSRILFLISPMKSDSPL